MSCPLRTVSIIQDAPRGPLPSAVPVQTRLIRDSSDLQGVTANRSVDARTALALGLAEYISTLSIEWAAGRLLRFARVYSSWADPEDLAEYPASVVLTDAPGDYGASRLTPQSSKLVPLYDDLYLISTSEAEFDLRLEVWANDIQERSALVAMLEDGLSPFESMYGLRLQLPYYFNQIADYEPISMVYLDSEENAMKRYRKAVIMVKGRMPVTKLMTAKPLEVRLDVEIADLLEGAGVFKVANT